MATQLRCPACGAHFDFSAWQKAASCPACGRRVRFEDAVAAGKEAVGAAPTSPSAAVPQPAGQQAGPPTVGAAPSASPATAQPLAAAAPASVAPGSAGPRTFLGKPLKWTRAWTSVVVVWVVVAIALIGVRVQMGHLAPLTPREQDAIGAVEKAPLETGVTYGDALQRVEKTMHASPADALWYVQDRSWEKRRRVYWQLGSDVLSWTVAYGGGVSADAGTNGILKDYMQLQAKPGGLPTLPTVPGL